MTVQLALWAASTGHPRLWKIAAFLQRDMEWIEAILGAVLVAFSVSMWHQSLIEIPRTNYDAMFHACEPAGWAVAATVFGGAGVFGVLSGSVWVRRMALLLECGFLVSVIYFLFVASGFSASTTTYSTLFAFGLGALWKISPRS